MADHRQRSSDGRRGMDPRIQQRAATARRLRGRSSSSRGSVLAYAAGGSLLLAAAGTAFAWWKYNSYKKERQERRRRREEARAARAAEEDGDSPVTKPKGKTQTEEKASEIEAFVMPTADQFMQLLAHLDSDPFPRQAIKDRFFTAFRALSSDTFPTEHIVIAATNVLTGFTSSIGAPVPIHTLTEEQKALDLLNEQDLKQVWKLLQEDMSEQLRPHVSQLKLQAALQLGDPQLVREAFEALEENEANLASRFLGAVVLGRWSEFLKLRKQMSDDDYEFLNSNTVERSTANFDALLELAEEKDKAGEVAALPMDLVFGKWIAISYELSNFRVTCEDDEFRTVLEERAKELEEQRQKPVASPEKQDEAAGPSDKVAEEETDGEEKQEDKKEETKKEEYTHVLDLQGAYASMKSFTNSAGTALAGTASKKKISLRATLNPEKSPTYSSMLYERLELVRDEEYTPAEDEPEDVLAFRGVLTVEQELDLVHGYTVECDVTVRFVPGTVLHENRC